MQGMRGKEQRSRIFEDVSLIFHSSMGFTLAKDQGMLVS